MPAEPGTSRRTSMSENVTSTTVRPRLSLHATVKEFCREDARTKKVDGSRSQTRTERERKTRLGDGRKYMEHSVTCEIQALFD